MSNILGVDIREKTLGLSVLEKKIRTAKPLKSRDLDLPEDKDQRDLFIVEAIKNAKQQHDAATMVVGLPLSFFSFSHVEMPVMNRKDLRNALSFELERHLPLPVDEYLYDFIALPYEKDRTRIMVLSVRKDIIASIVGYAKEAGIDLAAIRCSLLTMVPVLMKTSGGKNFSGLIINAQDDFYEIACIVNARPVNVKSCRKGPDINLEVERLASSCPGSVLVNGRPDMLSAERFHAMKSQLSASSLLASSAVKNTPLDFNFLPQELVKGGRDVYQYLLAGLAAAAVLLFMLSGLVSFYREWSALRSVNSQVAALKERASGIIEAQKKTLLLNQDRQILSDFRSRSNMTIKAMNDLSRTIPSDAWVINMSIDEKGKIEIEGFAKKTSALIIALEKSGLFKNIAFTSPITAKDGEERFAVRMDLEGI